jgi:hypothetical protein
MTRPDGPTCARCASGVCCACGSRICLRMSAAAQARHDADQVRAVRHFANPATFGRSAPGGRAPDLAGRCGTLRTARPHSRPSGGQQGRGGRANRAGSHAPAGE